MESSCGFADFELMFRYRRMRLKDVLGNIIWDSLTESPAGELMADFGIP